MLIQLINETDTFTPDAGTFVNVYSVPNKYFLYKGMPYSVTKTINLAYDEPVTKETPVACLVVRQYPELFTGYKTMDSEYKDKSKGLTGFTLGEA